LNVVASWQFVNHDYLRTVFVLSVAIFRMLYTYFSKIWYLALNFS